MHFDTDFISIISYLRWVENVMTCVAKGEICDESLRGVGVLMVMIHNAILLCDAYIEEEMA